MRLTPLKSTTTPCRRDKERHPAVVRFLTDPPHAGETHSHITALSARVTRCSSGPKSTHFPGKRYCLGDLMLGDIWSCYQCPAKSTALKDKQTEGCISLPLDGFSSFAISAKA
ncbi:hypothetical protein CHS0354_000005 [Potamilus streckersoni]|uniref:Uncharacterized protein n=1 Tax=Potamilus streckersoni TaxID=2493646 RepID=A0AAE0W2H8_9BIVA|nr:hypothetical protein CHS0354_000005 [Potamilus streckersoni]